MDFEGGAVSRLGEIRAYVERATGGPWFTVSDGLSLDIWTRDKSRYGAAGEAVDPSIIDSLCDADAEFITRARTDMPLLLEVADAAWKLWEGDYERPGFYPDAIGGLRAALARLEEPR